MNRTGLVTLTLVLLAFPIVSGQEANRIELDSGPAMDIRPNRIPGLVTADPIPLERRSQIIYHKVKVNRLVTGTVFVPVKTSRQVMRPVYRKVERVIPDGQMVLVPVKTKERRVRMVYEERTRTELQTRTYYVQEKSFDQRMRTVYREVAGEPVNVSVLVPVKTTEVRPRLVYHEESIPVRRTVCDVYVRNVPVTEAGSGRVSVVQQPVTEHRQVKDTVKRYAARVEMRPEEITQYSLQTRTAVQKRYAAYQEPIGEVTMYRAETRTVPTEVKEYVLVARDVEEEVTRYETQVGPRKYDDYVAALEPVTEEETIYRPEVRTQMAEVEIYVPCVQEVLLPGTTNGPALLGVPAQQFDAVPCPGCGAATAVENGHLTALGALSRAPLWR